MKKYTYYLSVLFLLSFFCVSGQDTHYWTNQFGTRSALMSGAVVGGARDNTMIFYNPAALVFMKNTSVSVNANAYNVQNIKIENALGEQADYLSNQSNSVPLLAGGLIRMKSEKVKVGYGIMAPVDFSFKGIARVDNNIDVINEAESPGEEELVGESSVSTDLRELAFILSSSTALSEKWSVGVTSLFVFRSHLYNRSLNAYVFPNNPNYDLIGGNLLENVDYYNLRYVLKLGLLYRTEPWSFGLTFSAPSLNLFGRGTTASNLAARNLRFNAMPDRVSGVATDRQSKLKTRFRSPWSAAIGLNYRGERSGIGVAAEYFGGVDVYTIMQPAANTFVRPESLAPELGSDLFLNTPAGASPVFNVAAGYEYFLNERWTLYLSARNNMSSFNPDVNDAPGIRTTLSSWDIYHLTSGATINNERTSISFGLLLSSGRDDEYEQQGNLAQVRESDLVKGTVTITEAKYFTAGFLFGFTYFFDRLQFEKRER